MSRTRRIAFQQVDVFTAVPFKGNPVAVVLEGEGLRIFTPRAEIPFAGHPTIGSAHAVLHHGRAPRQAGRLVQECGKGLVDLRVDGERLFLELPSPAFREPTAAERAQAAAAIGLTAAEILNAAIIDVGPVWFTLQLRDGGAVAKLEPDMAAIAALSRDAVTGLTVFGFYGDGGPADLEVRSFAPAHGVPEDPVCGSGNGCVAAFIQREQLLGRSSYVSSQGRCMQRDGRVEVRFADDGRIWLGGHAVTCVEGALIV
jgi:PhzF family phenazine biosynthesis protein